MNIGIIREGNQSSAGVLQVFQIYDRWSAEEMKILLCLGLMMEVRGFAFRNASG